MTPITIRLPDERLKELQDLARRFAVSPEELVCASIEEFLRRPEDEFRRALDLVLARNAEIYRRLA